METKIFITRILLALLAGSVLGLERQWNRKNAGLRTNTLVALGSSIFVLISIILTAESGDVTRIIGQVVTGTGFLGAGVIMHKGADIQGITTAATIWCSSAIGCLAGLGMVTETIFCTLLIVFINVVFVKVDIKMGNRNNDKQD